MPINPQIYVPQILPMQLQDPMVFARNALAMEEAESSIAANQLKVKRANQLAGLIKGGTKPLTPQDLLSAGLFEEAESLAKAENALTAGQKSSLDVVGAAMDTSARLLDTVRTPQEMMAWHEANHADPVLGKYLAARGITAEQSRAKIAEAAKDPVAFQQLVLDARLGLKDSRKQHFIEQNYGGGTRVLAMGEYGGPARAVEGSDIKVTASPNRPVTNILPTAKKFGEKFGEKAAEQFDILYTQAQGAEQSINLSRQLKPLLNNPDFISGTLANVRLELAKALDLPGAEETQAYFAGIGGQVAQIIKSFGAGTGLSDADRKFAERMAGGSEELTTDAIKKIVRLNDEASKFVLKKYNTRRSELSRKDREIADYYPEVRVAVREGTIKSGPDKGRRVVEYSDGTSEYAD